MTTGHVERTWAPEKTPKDHSGDQYHASVLAAWTYVLAQHRDVDVVALVLAIDDKEKVVSLPVDPEDTLKNFHKTCQEVCAKPEASAQQDYRENTQAFYGLRFHGDHQDIGQLRLCLTVSLPTESDGSLRLVVQYDESHTQPSEAQWMLDHTAIFLTDLDKGISSDSTRLDDVPLVNDHEKSCLLALAGKTSQAEPQVYTDCYLLHDFINAQAKRTPDALALTWLDERKFTFAQLEEEAQSLAEEIFSLLGEKSLADQVIALCFGKGPLMIISLLAVLKAGAAYTNIEAEIPGERKDYICQETKTRLVLTTSDIRPQLEKQLQKSLKIHCVDKENRARPKGLTIPRPDPSNLAYVIYTSGSTGRPKGIAVEHRQVAAFLRNYRGVFHRRSVKDAGGQTRVLQFSSYSFDVSVMNIFDTLAHGACLVTAPLEDMQTDLAGVIRRLEITTGDITPSVCSIIADEEDLGRLEHLNMGGEPSSLEIRDKWLKRGMTLVNDYGPSETTVGCIHSEPKDSAQTYIDIGRPTGSNKVYLLRGTDLRCMAPIGTIGEICVGGDQVTRGYLNRPDLTEAAFFDHHEFGRLYRTGDLGRYDPSRAVADVTDAKNHALNIICLGRRDGQVKINGLRIEVGEIEHAIMEAATEDKDEDAKLASAVVLYIKDASAGLIAVLHLAKRSSQNGASDSKPPHLSRSGDYQAELIKTVRSSIVEELPKYMIPDAWVIVDDLPLQQSGKTDRNAVQAFVKDLDLGKYRFDALVKQHGGKDGRQKEESPSSDEVEADPADIETVKSVWSRVLKVSADEMGPTTSFTSIGGDSIAEMKVVSALKGQGHNISINQSRNASTVAELAKLLGQKSAGGREQPVDDYKPFCLLKDKKASVMQSLEQQHGFDTTQIEDVYTCSPMQRALISGSLEGTHYYSQAVYRCEKSIDVEHFEKCLGQLVERNGILRSVIAVSEHTEDLLQVVLTPESARITVTSETVSDCQKAISHYLSKDRSRSTFEFGRILTRFHLVSTEEELYLVWSLHHVMSDGWTLELLFEDLHLFLTDDAKKVTSRPSFGTLSRWYAQQDRDEGLDYWQKYLRNAGFLEWPLKFREGQTAATNNKESIEWSGPLSQISKELGITSAQICRLALGMTLALESEKADIVFGTVRSGRDVPVDRVEAIIGPCITTLPTRFHFKDKQTTIREMLKAENKNDRDARQYQSVPISDLATHLGKDRRGLFTILFTYQSQSQWEIAEGGEKVQRQIEKTPESIQMPTDYALSIEITPSNDDPDCLDVAVFYDGGLVKKELVSSFLSKFGTVLSQLLKKADTSLEGFSIKDGATELALTFDDRSSDDDSSDAVSGKSNAATHGNGKSHEEEQSTKDDSPFEWTESAKNLQQIWAQVLSTDLSKLDEKTRWRDCGGDSIKTMMLSARMKGKGITIPYCRLAELDTIEKQARAADGEEK